jgi:hypothetical protein
MPHGRGTPPELRWVGPPMTAAPGEMKVDAHGRATPPEMRRGGAATISKSRGNVRHCAWEKKGARAEVSRAATVGS